MLRKKLLIGVLALAFVLVVGVSTADAYSTLRLGSKGADVVTLQTKLGGLTADGSFGNLTLAAVKAFQTNKGLTADGVVGPMTWAALMSGTTTTTGNLPAGCTSTVGYSSTTGQKCDSTTGSTVTGPLTGGAGDVTLSHYSTGEKSSIAEGDSDTNVLGFKVEADGSDVAVTSAKISFEVTNPSDASYKITKYLDSADLYKGSTKVGSVDASDFSKDSSNVYTKSVSLSNAIVREGDKDAFSVKFNMLDDVDTANTDAEFTVALASIRFQDAEGVITTIEPDSDIDNNVSMEDSSTTDKMDVKSSSNKPDATTVTVDSGSDTTDDVLMLAFKLKTGADSADVTLNSIPLTVTLDNNMTAHGTVEDVINSVTVKIGSDEYEAVLSEDDNTVANGEGTAVYIVDLDGEDVILDGDSTTEVKVYVSFEGTNAEGNYAENTTVTVDVAGATIDAETDNTELLGDVSGDQNGNVFTLSTVGAEVSGYDWKVNSTGTIVDFFFTVEATGDENVDVLIAGIADSIDAGSTSTIVNPASGVETNDHGILTKYSGDSVDALPADAGFTVSSGDKTTFRLRYSFTGSNGQWAEVTVTSVAGQTVPEDDQTSPTATVSGM